MAILNGLTTNTTKNLQLDAGIIATGNLDINAWDGSPSSIPSFKALGATKGATTLSIIPELRNIFDGIDGCRGYYKGGTVIDNWDITLKATVSELTVENIKKALLITTATAPSGGASRDNYDILTPKLEISETTDYIDKLYWLGTMAGQSKPIIIELYNVLNMSGFTLGAEDKATGSIEVEFRAHIELKSPKVVPVKIYLPKASESGAELAHVELDEIMRDKK